MGKLPLIVSSCLCVLFLTVCGCATSDILISDFEGNSYGEWKLEGEAFGRRPAKGTLPNQQEVTGYTGKGLVNTYYLEGDELQGTLTSPSFKMERRYINFLIGGGAHPAMTYVSLMVDGESVRSATGKNDEKLEWVTFDVSQFQGRNAVILIVDESSDDWGHITVDEIIQSGSAKAKDVIKTAPRHKMRTLTREIEVAKRYINLPLKNGVPKQRIRFMIDGEIVREFVIELAESEPDFWVFTDVIEFKGKRLKIESFGLSQDSKILEALIPSNKVKGGENIYREKLRPQFHFTSKRGWNNDTNGMVYYDGEYHMFYQHNPFGWPWGNMTWGHAVSTDMIHWRELGDAIHPDKLGTIFSGSAVVDADNTAGFKTGAEDVTVCFYTSAGGTNPLSKGEPFTQSIAYSNDRGRTFTKYQGNPIIGHIRGGNRDPKVIWHEPTKKWVMVLYVEEGDMDFFTSTDLKNWTNTSRLKSFHECPELFELPVDEDENNKKWVLYGAAADYFIGSFDGKEFKPETESIKFNHGNAFYASQTFSDIPEEDGRRIMMGWGQVPMPDMPWNQMITFPLVLSLRTTNEGIRMFAEPVEEVEKLHKKKHSLSGETINGIKTLPGIDGELFHIKAEFEVGDADSFGLIIREFNITYDAKNNRIRCKSPKSNINPGSFSRPQSAPLKPVDGKITLEILVDRTMVEVFPNNGRYYFPMGAYLVDKDPVIKVFSEGGKTKLINLEVNELNSIWHIEKE